MIRLNRTSKPKLLEDNEYTWLCHLKAAIAAYGSYSAIPQDEKSKLTKFYRHDDIKEELFKTSFEKCAFCECKPAEGGNIEVEHFKPKSIHPDFTFEWENLLPSCRKCNGSKLDHDTAIAPIVNPYEMDPKEIFEYSDIRILAKSGASKSIGDNSIEVCGLNSVRLMKPRSEILVNLYFFQDTLQEAMADYHDADTGAKKRNRVRSINEAIEKIEQLTDPREKYSGFCSNFLENCEIYNKAKALIKDAMAA